MPSTSAEPSHESHQLAAGLLIGAAALALLAMAHHPTAHGASTAETMAVMARIAPLNSFIHGVLIVLTLLILALLEQFATHRVRRPGLARAGRTLYLLDSMGMVLAALINGFAVPALAISNAPVPGSNDWGPVLQFAWQLNQAAAGFGTIAYAVAIGLWSADLAAARGFARIVGAYGLLLAVVVAVAVGSGKLSLDVSGFGMALAAFSLWQIGAGAVLWRRAGFGMALAAFSLWQIGAGAVLWRRAGVE